MEPWLLLLTLVSGYPHAARERAAGPGAPPETVEARFQQVYPVVREGMQRTPGQTRAVFLLHGVRIHPISSAKVYEPQFHDWQLPGSTLVKALSRKADVFAFAYGQNTRLETIASLPALASAIAKLRFLGYVDIVLFGHSTGGVVARLFVEDRPRCGVTRVIQVCAPNDGSSWANLHFSLAREQEPLLQSLTRKDRILSTEIREDKRIPDNIDFLCVVGASGPHGDGMVACKSQWPPDLQKQGIPAVRLATTHLTVLRAPKTVERIAELVWEDHQRWSAEKVEAQRKAIVP